MPFTFRKIAIFSGAFLIQAFVLSIYLQLELPASSGPYTVGRTVVRRVDTSRPEVLTQEPNDFREIVALVWYPAERETGAQAGYFPDLASVAEALAQSGEVARWQVSGLRFVRSPSPLDASPLTDGGPFPVVMLSPGNGTNIEFYSILASEIACHGYGVVGLNHPYDVTAVELSDGQIAPYNKNQWSLTADAQCRANES